MSKEELKKRIIKAFLVESDEEIERLNRAVIELEKACKAKSDDRYSDILKSLFRSAHTLKGSSRALSIESMESVCHLLETRFGELREGKLSLSRKDFDKIFQVLDELKNMRDEVARTGSVNATSSGRAIKVLESLCADGSGGEEKHEFLDIKEGGSGIPASLGVADSNYVRIEAKKLDKLLAQSGELQIAWQRLDIWDKFFANTSSSLTELISEINSQSSPVADEGRPSSCTMSVSHLVSTTLQDIRKEIELGQIAHKRESNVVSQSICDVDNEIRSIRMLPFSSACLSLDRVVRDIASAQNKDVCLLVEGEDVEVDRSIIEAVKDPLLHLVRNAIDHGIEDEGLRGRLGKSEKSTVQVTASIRGSRLEVSVADDGKGLDRKAIAAKCQSFGWPVPELDSELLHLVFEPRFSTSQLVTEVSGRGVGLDIVKSNIDSVHGSIDVSSKEGEGSEFVMSLPLTLTTLRTMLVRCGGQIIAFSISNIDRIVDLHRDDLAVIQGATVYSLGENFYPVVRLRDILGFPTAFAGAGKEQWGLLLASEGAKVLFLVDEVLEEQEIVVKSLGKRLSGLTGIQGGAILPNGSIAIIAHPSDLIRLVIHGNRLSIFDGEGEMGGKTLGKKILLVDDSITTRCLEQSILESAGHQVVTAMDGRQGWEYLLEYGADIIVSDVEMPNMSGIELTKAVRNSPRFRDIPIILVTSLSEYEEQQRGLEAGANAYLIKSDFDQDELLDTVSRLCSTNSC